LIALEDSWRRLAESIPHIVWVASDNGDIEFMNQRATDYLGWSPQTLHEDIWNTVVHPDDAPEVYAAWQEAVSTQAAFSAEYRVRRADGEFRWFCGRARPVHEPGRPTRWICTATDIDDQRRAEAAVAEVAARLADAQRLTQVGSWSFDVADGIHRWSDQLYRLLGYEPAEFPPDKDRFFERLHPEDASRMQAAVMSQVSRPQAWQEEFRIVLPGDVERWLVARIEPVLGQDGQVVGIRGTAQEVTDRKRVEERLRLHADLLRAVGQAVIAVDLTGNIIYWGPGAEELYGWEAEEALSRHIADVIPTAHGRHDAAEMMGDRHQGGAWTGILELRRRDGSTFLAEVTRTPVLDTAGRLVALIGTSSDVSAREELNANLRRAHRTAEETMTLLATLQEEAPLGFALVDTELRLVQVNRELASFVGAPAEDLIGRMVGDVLPAALWKEVESVYNHVLSSGEVVRDRRVIAPDGPGGRPRQITTSHYPVRVGEELIGVGVVVNDVTDSVRAEGFRSAVMSQVVDGVYTTDCEGRLRYMNSAASKMLGWTEDDLRGRYMHEVVAFTRSDGSRVSVTEHALLTEGTPGRLDQSAGETFTRKDGSTFPVAYSAVPLRIGSSVEGVAVVFRDISEPGASPNVIRVLIADSDRNATTSCQALLDWHEGIVVVAVERTSASALAGAVRLKPDVMLVDAELPELHGLATTVAVKASAPSTKIILMTENYDDVMALASIDAGCAGVLDKSRAWVELVSAVRAAYHGETILSQQDLQRVLSTVRGGQTGRAMRLTDREEDVLACLREGLSNASVAERLGVTPNTVRNHVQRILYKLNVHSKVEAVVLTSREGLTDQGSNR
jgi:PAS domain S-box-containing protein